MLTRSCLLSLALMAALSAAYYVALTPYFEWPVNAFAAVAGAVFTGMFLSALINARQAFADARAIRRAEAHEPPRDGRLAAAMGTVAPLGAPLTAPFSGEPCVAYEYEAWRIESVQRSGRSESHQAYDAVGFALAPSAVSTTAGSIRLLGWAVLDQFPARSHEDEASILRAAAYFAETPAVKMPAGVALQAVREMEKALADDDGAVRTDWRMRDVDLEEVELSERIVPVGASVCALGLYSAERRGLVAGGQMVNRLYSTTGPALRRQIAREATTRVAAGLALFLVSHALLAGALYLSETRHARDPEDRQWRTIMSAVQSNDAAALERAVRRRASPDARDETGRSVLFYARQVEMVEALVRLGSDVNLRDREGETPLFGFARLGDPHAVRLLVEAGADVDARSNSGETPLDAAALAGREEVAAYLREKGARGTTSSSAARR